MLVRVVFVTISPKLGPATCYFLWYVLVRGSILCLVFCLRCFVVFLDIYTVYTSPVNITEYKV